MTKQKCYTICCAIILVASVTGFEIQRQVEQSQLDNDLVCAIRHNEAADVRRLLSHGANAKSLAQPRTRLSMWEYLRNRIQGRTLHSGNSRTSALFEAVI